MNWPKRLDSLLTVWVLTICTRHPWWKLVQLTERTMSMCRWSRQTDVTRINLHCRTGETPWVKLMIEKYHETAKSNGAIVSSIQLVAAGRR